MLDWNLDRWKLPDQAMAEFEREALTMLVPYSIQSKISQLTETRAPLVHQEIIISQHNLSWSPPLTAFGAASFDFEI